MHATGIRTTEYLAPGAKKGEARARLRGESMQVKALATMGLDPDVIWHQVRNSCMRLSTMNAEAQASRAGSTGAFRVYRFG